MLPPDELLDALDAALERESHETDFGARGQMLSAARGTMAAWLHGDLTTFEAIEELRRLRSPRPRR